MRSVSLCKLCTCWFSVSVLLSALVHRHRSSDLLQSSFVGLQASRSRSTSATKWGAVGSAFLPRRPHTPRPLPRPTLPRVQLAHQMRLRVLPIVVPRRRGALSSSSSRCASASTRWTRSTFASWRCRRCSTMHIYLYHLLATLNCNPLDCIIGHCDYSSGIQILSSMSHNWLIRAHNGS